MNYGDELRFGCVPPTPITITPIMGKLRSTSEKSIQHHVRNGRFQHPPLDEPGATGDLQHKYQTPTEIPRLLFIPDERSDDPFEHDSYQLRLTDVYPSPRVLSKAKEDHGFTDPQPQATLLPKYLGEQKT